MHLSCRLPPAFWVVLLVVGCKCPNTTDIEEGAPCEDTALEYYCPHEPPVDGSADYAYQCVRGEWSRIDDEGWHWAYCDREERCPRSIGYIE